MTITIESYNLIYLIGLTTVTLGYVVIFYHSFKYFTELIFKRYIEFGKIYRVRKKLTEEERKFFDNLVNKYL